MHERSADSMKRFWSNHAFKTLEEYLIECVHEGTDFCFSFKEIPNPDFVRRFKTQFASEFIKMETLQNMSDAGEQDDERFHSFGLSKNLGRNLAASLGPDG